MAITLISVFYGGHLVWADSKDEFLYFQATMLVDGVEIGNVAIIAE